MSLLTLKITLKTYILCSPTSQDFVILSDHGVKKKKNIFIKYFQIQTII